MSSYTSYWQSPSNIALVKYWGKKAGVQIPANASISFTLSNCHTQTKLRFNDEEAFGVKVLLDGEEQAEFIPKILQFFDRIAAQLPFVKLGYWTIETSNSFPHSSGIASSASGMSALAMCICDIATQKGDLPDLNHDDLASELARLGSGSAARSVFGPLAVWGNHPAFDGSSDHKAMAYSEVHPVFKTYCDTILLVHKGRKSVSSSVGHDLLIGHPYAEVRFAQAQAHMFVMKEILRSGDLKRFIKLVELEALSLHALMMSSNPSFILMKAETLQILEEIRKAREQKGVNWCFTLDAGANVHFLYPKQEEEQALEFVEKVLKVYCQDEAYICDHVGSGPINLN